MSSGIKDSMPSEGLHWYNYLIEPLLLSRGYMYASDFPSLKVRPHHRRISFGDKCLSKSDEHFEPCGYNKRYVSGYINRCDGPLSIDGISEDALEAKIADYESQSWLQRFYLRFFKQNYPIKKWTALLYYARIMRLCTELAIASKDLKDESISELEHRGYRVNSYTWGDDERRSRYIQSIPSPYISAEKLSEILDKFEQLKRLSETACNKISGISRLRSDLLKLNHHLNNVTPLGLSHDELPKAYVYGNSYHSASLPNQSVQALLSPGETAFITQKKADMDSLTRAYKQSLSALESVKNNTVYEEPKKHNSPTMLEIISRRVTSALLPLKQAYRQLSLRYHPDKIQDESFKVLAAKHNAFGDISSRYELLYNNLHEQAGSCINPAKAFDERMLPYRKELEKLENRKTELAAMRAETNQKSAEYDAKLEQTRAESDAKQEQMQTTLRAQQEQIDMLLMKFSVSTGDAEPAQTMESGQKDSPSMGAW